jgi:trimeric autotransporter adhesin
MTFLRIWVFLIAMVLLSVGGAAAENAKSLVIGFGLNLSGQATGEPCAIFSSQLSTGVVTIAGQVLTNCSALAAGSAHSLAVKSDGSVAAWGWNYYGQVTGGTNFSQVAARAAVGEPPLSNVVAVATAREQSFALLKSGTVVAWGAPRTESPVTPEDLAKYPSLDPSVPSSLTNIVAIASTWRHHWALRRDGSVVSWNPEKTVVGISNIVAIAAGIGHHAPEFALRADGVVFDLAWEPSGKLRSVATNAVAIAAGPAHGLALRADGTVYGWGLNAHGEATGTKSTDYFSGLVKVEGQILSNIVGIAAGNRCSFGIRQDGSLVCWGDPLPPFRPPSGLTNVAAVAPGEDFCLVLVTNTAASVKPK